ncbi:cobalamin biosynthesis protein [Methanosalsum natronophilum]|uniref:cobalamin biosynthesis protein n=1 Tax=Methanosalsum natronophilum TaxID=768733 RepID=UPI002166E58D|nr:cobalamin biosynthesis protein [Methanosalsum natronophilum]MCS3923336.1 adenosylcobinamide-phosphate synthase [Methanosalsum natronophilum]
MLDLIIPIFSIDGTFLIYVLILAFVFDILLGEPPAAVHPVVWIGRFVQFFKERAPVNNRKLYGVILAVLTMIFSSLIAVMILLVLTSVIIPEAVRLLIGAYFLKSTFAIQSLLNPAKSIASDILNERYAQAREKLPIFVSRDPSTLSEEQVSSAVIESVSENYVDGIITPLFYYMLLGPLGLVAAYVYKGVNTLDSMIGYKDEEHIELGYFSAKMDDVLNWVPARLSILFIAGSAAIIWLLFPAKKGTMDVRSSLRLASTQSKRTPSPNSGYPMAAASGAIKVRLEKPNNYVLGEQYALPKPEDINRVSQLIFIASILSFAAFAAAINFAWIWY